MQYVVPSREICTAIGLKPTVTGGPLPKNLVHIGGFESTCMAALRYVALGG